MKVNNMKTIIRNSILGGLAFCMGTACTKETGIEGISEPKSYLEVFASIGEVSTAPARANEEEENTSSYKDIYGVPMDVLYSYLPTNGGGGFVNGCQIGIYSRYDTNGEYTAGRLVNEPLTFKGKSFVSESIEIPSMTNLGPTFAYYPYSTVNTINNEQSTNNKILRSELDIYVKENNNDPYTEGNNNTVIDLLTASNGGSLSDDGTIFYAFKHACSMLLIYRGEGFDEKNGEDNEVKVKLETGRKTEVNNNNGNFSLLVINDESKPTEFTANYCDNYGANNDEKVYSVILPPGAKVKYIQMEDNFGTMQYIYPEETLTLSGGWRYPVTVKLDGLYPTIYPHDITEWDDQIITIDTKNPGIYNLDGFNNWIEAYNEFPQNDNKLDDYGKKDNNGKWTFHLYADIDCDNITAASLIPTFSDCLDGHGHTLKNITLTPTDGKTNIGIIGELKDEGSIENLKVEGITVSGGTGDSHYTGTIAGTITKGNITECKITGIDINCPNGFVGALAGKISEGTVTTCLLEGNLQLGIEANIDADSKKLFGEMPENFNLNEDVINTAGVYVFRSNVDNTQTEEGTGTGDGVDAGNG